MSTSAATGGISSYREQGLSATVHLACVHCQAPGVFCAEDRIKRSWAGCYVSSDDERVGLPVGDRCPNCLASRGPSLMKRLGEIWRKRYTKAKD